MEFGGLPEPDPNARPGTRSLTFEIDLNETPLPSPRETLAADEAVPAAAAAQEGNFSGEVQGSLCRSCGKDGEVQNSREWKCFKCLLSNGGEKLGGRAGLLDINASPPLEVDGEGFIENVPSFPAGVADLGDKVRTVRDISFLRHSLGAPVTTSNMLFMENGFNHLKASRGATQIPKSGFEDVLLQRLGKSSKEPNLNSTLNGGLWQSHCTPENLVLRRQSESYLQALREYIHEKRGLLGDGWHVEFIYCKNRCKTFAVYCAPDGSRFDSMSDVAGYLGLLTTYSSLETQDRSDGFAVQAKGFHSDGRRKEILRFSRANKNRENHSNLRSSSLLGISSGTRILGHQTEGFECSKSAGETVSMEHGRGGFDLLQDICPLQFEDLFVLSLGKIDTRPSYHTTGQIWPVGYRSCWHDKITGSIFVSEVVDGGDAGPNFKVQRYPCYTNPIPISTTVLFRQKSQSYDGQDKVVNDDSTTSAMDVDEILSIKLMLAEDSPPHLEDVDFGKANSSAAESSRFPERSGNIVPDSLGLGDHIGEFSVEGRSSSMVWEMASQFLLRACYEVYKKTGKLQFFCKHNDDGVNTKAAENVDSLSKFCNLSGPTDIPHLVQSKNEFATFSEMLMKWLRRDRFGLDVEFVQELLEQLPGVHACSEYKFLTQRSQDSGSQTVKSGFLLVERNRNVQGGRLADGILLSCKRPRKLLVEDSEMKKSFPLGKPLSAKIPAYLIGDVLQVWEFLWRFSEVLGLEEAFPFQELENELMNPWLDSVNPLEGAGKEIKKFRGFTLCTGEALRKAHSSLLKVVVGEVLLKVSGYVDPNSDAEECKSRRGRRKDADNAFASKKLKFDMLQINELTWPELARRYILAVLSMEGNVDSGEITFRESSKIFHCLRGDGGILCGSLTGVAGMKADALFLAEASKQVFGTVKKKFDFISIDQDKSDTMSNPERIEVNVNEVPEWVQALEPVRKLPTNVGARIRKCVHEALGKDPPEWAKKIMQHSISKEVYKGNASGPTKRAIVSLLANVNQIKSDPKPEKKEKVKSVSTISDLIMKQCRIVLRRIAAEDEERVFCNLLGRSLSLNDNDDEGLLGYPAMVSRPLDFRTIDIRLATGAYGGSHEAFLDDVQEVWNNIRTAFADQSDLIDLAESLSQKFEDMYKTEVQKFAESANSLSIDVESKKEIADMLMHANETSIPKAPWDEGICKVCGVDKDDDNVLLCDTCDSEYHTYCLSPPLARIPEGNWYCPSCVASQFKSKGSHGNRVNWCQKKRYRGEFTRNFMERLSKLARTMGSKEYWDFNLEERILLMKFLCDETLNSSILRDHLDHCANTSTDLQQKLRFLSSEWKNLKVREDILAANLEKENAVHNKVGELAPDVLAYILNKDVLSHPPLPQQQKNGVREENALKDGGSSTSQVSQGLVSSDSGSTHVVEHMLNGHHSSSQPDASAVPENNHEMSSLKHEISVLQDSIASVESELQKVSLRKEILGKDSVGRVYQVFDRVDMSSLLVVNGSVELEREGPTYNNSNFTSFQYGMGNPSSSRGPRGLSLREYVQNNGVATPAWVSYQSDAEIKEVIGLLSDSDARERELKESILHWHGNKPQDSNNAENRIQNEKQPSCSKLSDDESNFLVTKALTALDKNYGPFLGSEAKGISKQQGQKCKENCEEKMYRCECLEPIWPSKLHCLSCHRTYPTSEELEKHKDGKCNEGSAITKNQRVSEDSLKGKNMATETSVRKRPDNNGIGRASKSEKNEIGFDVNKFHDRECPYDFKEISAKFVTQNSLKELVRDVGLIGSSGTPTLVPSVSPYLGDPALRLVPTRKNEVDSGNGSMDWKNTLHQSISGMKIEVGMGCDSGSNKYSRYFGNDRDEGTSKFERLISNFTYEGDWFSSFKNKSLMDGVGSRCVVPESSSRRLVGRVSQILKQLKVNLLDIDAALPEEALKPSMSHLEKRSAWRAFVKLAGSIYEMVQATIILENMVKADYLKKDWWYWSSLSAAANISTLSALALRVYTFDAAIIFEKPSLTSDSTEIPESGEAEGGTPSKLDPTNTTKTSSPQIQKTPTELTDSSKAKARPSKRRKDSGG